MESSGSLRLGAWACVGVGLSYLLVGAGYLMQPAEQRTGTVDEVLLSRAVDAAGFKLSNWALALGGIVALAAVPAMCRLVGERNGWVMWARNLGVVGFAVASVNAFRNLQIGMMNARQLAFVSDPANADEWSDINQVAIFHDHLRTSLDPDGWLAFGAVGLFVLIVSVVGMRRGAFPPSLAGVGAVTFILYALVVAAFLNSSDTLFTVASVGAIIVGPLFFVWTGLRLRMAAAD